MAKFKFKKYDPKTNDVVSTDVPPSPDGSDKDWYLMPTGLKDGNGKCIFNLDIIIEHGNDDDDIIKKDSGVVISNLEVCDKNGNKQTVNVAIFDGGVEFIDINNAGDFAVIGNVSSTPELLK